MLKIRGSRKQGWLSYLTNSIDVGILFKNSTVDVFFVYQNHQICRYIAVILPGENLDEDGGRRFL